MGMTGAEWALLGGSLGGNAIGSLFAPDGQDIQSFADNPNVEIDPGVLMDQLKEMLVNFRDPLWNRINRGNALPSAVIQQPPVFDGGGLPIPIGLTASDPALTDPALLSSSANWTESDAGAPLGSGTIPDGGGGGGGGNLPPRNGDDPSGRYTTGSGEIPPWYTDAPWWDGEENFTPPPWWTGPWPPWGTDPTSPPPTREADPPTAPTPGGGGGGGGVPSPRPGEGRDGSGGDPSGSYLRAGTAGDDATQALGAITLLTSLHNARPSSVTAGAGPRRRPLPSVLG